MTTNTKDTKSTKSEPPRAPDALLRRVLPSSKRGLSILGDLREEFHAIPNERAARRWYWLQALRLSLRYSSRGEPQVGKQKGSIMPHDLRSDLRTALRMFVRNPGTSTLIVFTLAITIGAATVGFAFADLALFRGLPVDDSSKVVSIFASDTRNANLRRVSGPDYLDYRERARGLARVSAFRQASAPLITNGQSSTLSVTHTTADFFAAMGQTAAPLGRVLRAGDDDPGAAPVVVLSHHYWQEAFGGRSDAVGKTLQIGREIFTVVGVVTPEMEFGNLAEIDVWLPLHLTRAMPRDLRNLRFIARLAEGVRFETAAAEVASIGDSLASEYPDTNRGWRVRLVPIRELTGNQNFWVVVALFLLSIAMLIAIATANVSNLIMVRAMARERELAVRSALGAKRGRLIRQLVVEGSVLSVAGAALSVPLAYAILQLIASLSPEAVFQQLRIDAHEMSFVAAIALICPLIFSLAPARSLKRSDTRQILASGGRGSTASMRGRGILVVAQVALAVVLLVTSGLALKSTNTLYSQPTGMQADRLLTFTLDFNEVLYPTTALSQAAAAAARDALQTMAGVDRVAMVDALPVLGAERLLPMTVDGRALADGESKPMALVTSTTPEANLVFGLDLLAGRWWREGESGIAVVSRDTATRYLNGIDAAIGRTLSVPRGDQSVPLTVIGVVSDVVTGDSSDWIRPRVWWPLDDTSRRLAFVVSAGGEPANLTSGVRAAVASVAPTVPIEGLAALDDALRRAAASDFLIIGVLTGFAVLALLLAATGLFGVVSYAAAQRTAEFGTRMALGASAFDVVRLVARQSLTLLAIGLGIGLAGGIGVGFGMKSALFGLSPFDPVTIGGVAALLTVVMLVATAIPAWRAGRIDPIKALRAE